MTINVLDQILTQFKVYQKDRSRGTRIKSIYVHHNFRMLLFLLYCSMQFKFFYWFIVLIVYDNMRKIAQLLIIFVIIQLAGTKCVPNCSICRNNRCVACRSGFYLYNRRCISCINSCRTCSMSFTKYKCLTCKVGSFRQASSQSCSTCPSQCQSCTSYTTCTSCYAGYRLSSSKTCVSYCQSGCSSCSTKTSCQICMDGYYLLAGVCKNCSDDCMSCANSSTCKACFDGYYLSSGLCYSCQNGCSACSGINSCISCLNGYKLYSGACEVVCMAGCAACSTHTTCFACNSGYYFSNDTCLACPAGCTLCQSRTSCSSCSDGFSLINGSCQILCPSGCARCFNISSCGDCLPGYYLLQKNCNPCPYGCKTCHSMTNCSSCIDEYYYSKETCKACSPGCAACTNSLCYICHPNYVLTALSECIFAQAPSEQSNSSTTVIIIGISAATGGIMLIIIAILVYRRLKSRQVEGDQDALSRELFSNMKIEWKDDKRSQYENEDNCPICQFSIGNALTKCGHRFHPICLYEWYKRKHSCPLCRSQMKIIDIYCQKCSQLHFELEVNKIPSLADQSIISCKNCEESQK